MTALAPPNAGQSATRIATLGGPAVTIEKTKTTTAAKSPDATLDRSLINKRLQAERAQERHRLAMRRARLARQAAVSQQQADNPFAPHPLVASPPAPAR
jgi:hypothetical protein